MNQNSGLAGYTSAEKALVALASLQGNEGYDLVRQAAEVETALMNIRDDERGRELLAAHFAPAHLAQILEAHAEEGAVLHMVSPTRVVLVLLLDRWEKRLRESATEVGVDPFDGEASYEEDEEDKDDESDDSESAASEEKDSERAVREFSRDFARMQDRAIKGGYVSQELRNFYGLKSGGAAPRKSALETAVRAMELDQAEEAELVPSALLEDQLQICIAVAHEFLLRKNPRHEEAGIGDWVALLNARLFDGAFTFGAVLALAIDRVQELDERVRLHAELLSDALTIEPISVALANRYLCFGEGLNELRECVLSAPDPDRVDGDDEDEGASPAPETPHDPIGEIEVNI